MLCSSCSICFTPSPHITAIFRFWAFLFGVPFDYTYWMQKSLRSQFCACERYSYAMCCVSCWVCSVPCALYTSNGTKHYISFCVLLHLLYTITTVQKAGHWFTVATTAIFRFWAFLCVCPCVSLRGFWTSLWTHLRVILVYCVSCWVCSKLRIETQSQNGNVVKSYRPKMVFQHCVLFLLLPHITTKRGNKLRHPCDSRHTPQPYFVSERFFCPALVFPRVPSERRSKRFWEPVRAISCVPLHHLRTPSPRVSRKTPVKVHRIITQKTITFSYLLLTYSCDWLSDT